MPFIIGELSALERCSDAVATYVEQHPALDNLALHELSKLLLGALVQEARAECASAMILAALIAVRDAPNALRGDTATISDHRKEARS